MAPTVFVSEQVLNEFREAVFQTHGKLYGELRREAEHALSNYAKFLKGRTHRAQVRRASHPPRAKELLA